MTTLKDKIEKRVQDYDFWATRRRYGAAGHNDASLWVLACMKTIDTFRTHPLIPRDVVVSGWIWEVETRRLRAPTLDPEKRLRTDVVSSAFGVAEKQPDRWN
jgi:hypothetical protein